MATLTPLQFANSKPRLYVALHEAPAQQSSFVTVQFPTLHEAFPNCFTNPDHPQYTGIPHQWRPTDGVRDVFFHTMAKLLGHPDMKIEQVWFLGGIGAQWHEVGPKMLSYTQENPMCLEDGLKLVVRKVGEPPFDRAKWNKARTAEDICMAGCSCVVS